MEPETRNMFVNSTLAFMCAFFITTFLHEGGHFVSYLISGAHPVLFHNYVESRSSDLTLVAKGIAAMAGPVVSLVQGMIAVFILSVIPKKGLGTLLVLWLALLGFVNFFGYLMMTPLSTAGDTGKVAGLLHLPFSLRIIIAVTGFVILMILVKKIGRQFAFFIPGTQDKKIRKKYVYNIMFFPIIAGSIVNTLFSFPIPVFLSAVYPATSSFIIMASFRNIMKNDTVTAGNEGAGKRISIPLIVLFFCCVVINRLLTLGFPV